ncbi:Histone-lysine N-methyltransferase SETMAR [Anthophora quadrimaculata]
MDETWIYQYDLEQRQQTADWTQPCCSAPKQPKCATLHYELLEHPPYSPDLAPSDFHLFPNLKKFLRGKRFSSNEKVIATANDYFEELPENHFREGINELENRWEKCIELKGEYTEE